MSHRVKPKRVRTLTPLSTTLSLDAEHRKQYETVKLHLFATMPFDHLTDACVIRHLVSIGLRDVLNGIPPEVLRSYESALAREQAEKDRLSKKGLV